MHVDAARDTGMCKQFHPKPAGSLNCKCGHTLYQHYMCGSPEESRCLACKDAEPTPCTQPSQTELRIPDDLKELYESSQDGELSECGATKANVLALIERIARLEGSR